MSLEEAETHRLLGRIEATLERVLHAVEKQELAHSSIEKRVSQIEGQIKWAAGIFSVITTFVVFTGDWFLKKLGIK